MKILVADNKNNISSKEAKEGAFDPTVLHTSNLLNFLNEYKRMANCKVSY